MRNHILRLMSFRKVKDKVNLNNLYLSHKILKLEDIFKLELAKFMYLYTNNVLPKVFQNYFKFMTDTQDYNTRNSSIKNLFLQRMSTTHAQSSSFFTGLKLWNSIPLNVGSVSYSRFIKFVKQALLSTYTEANRFHNQGREKGLLFLNVFSITSVMSK